MLYITYIEITVGVGLGLGPMMGSAVYSSLKYQKTMYMFGFLNVIAALAACIFVPNELNKT